MATIVTAAGPIDLGEVQWNRNGQAATWNVEGSSLTDDITVGPLTGVEFSLTGTGGWGNTVVLTETAGSVPSTPVYARIKATKAPGTFSSNVPHTSTGASTQNTLVEGEVVDLLADVLAGMGNLIKAFEASRVANVALLADFNTVRDDMDSAVLDNDKANIVNGATAEYASRQKTWNEALATALTPYLRAAMTAIGRPFSTQQQALDDFVKFLTDELYWVDAREVTHGADPADSSTGIFRRLAEYASGQPIEVGSPNETVKLQVVQVPNPGGTGRTRVRIYSNDNDGANGLVIKGNNINSSFELVGPSNPGGLVRNPNLTGNQLTEDGDAIDEDNGIPGWEQTRTGAPTVEVDTTNKFRTQLYGVSVGGGIGKDLLLEQDVPPIAMRLGIPIGHIAWFFLLSDGANPMLVDGTVGIGATELAFDETDLVDDEWAAVLLPFDQGLWPENIDETNNKYKLLIEQNDALTGDPRIVLGGFYVAQLFKHGGKYYIGFEAADEPVLLAEAEFGADSLEITGPIANAWVQAFPTSRSLPTSGSLKWVLPA